MDRPAISVIMSVYNSEKYLSESIQSVLRQTYSQFEFIIINDGSTDKSVAILDQFGKQDARIKIVHQSNRGLTASLNTALELSQGELIARMDADDICSADRLQQQKNVMDREPDCGLCHSTVSEMNEHGRTKLLKGNYGFFLSPLQTQWTLLWRNCIFHPTVMIRKKILQENNFQYNQNADGCEDYDLWCRLSKLSKCIAIHEPLVSYRRHKASVTHNYGENHLKSFTTIVKNNLSSLLRDELTDAQYRDITILSGQTYLDGMSLVCKQSHFYTNMLAEISRNFVTEYSLVNLEKKEIRHAAAKQLARWAKVCWPVKKMFLHFFIKSAAYAFSLSG